MNLMSLVQQRPIEEKPLQWRQSELKSPAAGEVTVSVAFCGICRTDLHIVEGDLKAPRLPITPGHQIVGTVLETGEDVDGVAEGERVGVPWMSATCGRCRFCESGRENLCDDARFTGLHIDGGYAEMAVVPRQFVYALAEGISSASVAPLLCAGVIGYRTLKLSGVTAGGRLALYGFGASAHVTIQIARHWGCDVYVFSRGDEHRAHAEALGAVWTGTTEDNPGVPLDAALIFAPAGPLMVDALEQVRKGGTVVSAGIHMSPIPEFPYEKIYGERSLTTAANATYNDGAELLQLAAEIPVKTDVELYPLRQANQALLDLKGSRFSGAAVLEI